MSGTERLEQGEEVTIETEFTVVEEFADTPAPDGSPTVELAHNGAYIRVPMSEVSRIPSEKLLCCMGCGDDVPISQAKKSADGSPRCPGCSRPGMEDYDGD